MAVKRRSFLAATAGGARAAGAASNFGLPQHALAQLKRLHILRSVNLVPTYHEWLNKKATKARREKQGPAESGAGDQDLVFRRGKLRTRDDPAIDIFREVLVHIRDISRVKRLLLELGRLYNPVTNGPILDLATRRRLVELLERGAEEEARGLLHECSAAYARRPEGQLQTGQKGPGENELSRS